MGHYKTPVKKKRKLPNKDFIAQKKLALPKLGLPGPSAAHDAGDQMEDAPVLGRRKSFLRFFSFFTNTIFFGPA